MANKLSQIPANGELTIHRIQLRADLLTQVLLFRHADCEFILSPFTSIKSLEPGKKVVGSLLLPIELGRLDREEEPTLITHLEQQLHLNAAGFIWFAIELEPVRVSLWQPDTPWYDKPGFMGVTSTGKLDYESSPGGKPNDLINLRDLALVLNYTAATAAQLEKLDPTSSNGLILKYMNLLRTDGGDPIQ